ncbi:hypothetical protein CCACVL1_24486 [Corchorus capsularis]|uniref:Homeobox domain-containing protein n=1 Tax=Corchorus capsularis TaxID=210143 RepID=A0A1R3GPE3_COCAP|nr:hypothetical protein CCACVL1_24486 [Corchorus capsularis]
MEELYGFSSSDAPVYSMETNQTGENMLSPAGNYPVVSGFPSGFAEHMFGSTATGQLLSCSSGISSDADSMVPEINHDHHQKEEVSSAIRAKIASHPLYPKLLQAYIDCQKVGAPPEIVKVLDEISGESNEICKRSTAFIPPCFGADPELDHFMATMAPIFYCLKLFLASLKEKAALLHATFSCAAWKLWIWFEYEDFECGGCRTVAAHVAILIHDEAVGSSEEELSGGEMEALEDYQTNEDRELKEKLLRKYSGYISTLKHEFSKKKKKGKLPKEARQTLLDWWNVHYKWPYPTEADKLCLAEATGLDQKQINNWFINQRKRHWKPSENMQIAVMDSLYGPFFHE